MKKIVEIINFSSHQHKVLEVSTVELDGGILRSSNTALSNINLQHHHHEFTVYI